MAGTRFNEPPAGSTLKRDVVGGDVVMSYRELEFSAWTDIAYKGVTTPGTPEQAQANTACRGLYIVGHPDNASQVMIGPTNAVRASGTKRGIPVYAGQAIPLPLSNTNQVYVDNIAGDQWAIVYFTHADS